MFKKNTKLKLITLSLLSFVLIFNFTFAATSSNLINNPPDFADMGGIITNFNKNIVQNSVVLLSGIALVVFLWGLVKFIYARSEGKDGEALKKGKDFMLWGLGAMFVLVTLWGIIDLAQGMLNLRGKNDILLPRICTNGSCDTVKSESPAQKGVAGGGTFEDKTKDKTKVKIIVGDMTSGIPEGEACAAGATTPGFICDTGLSCRNKMTGGLLTSGEGICKAVGIQLGESCMAGIVTESNSCGSGLSCQDANGKELRGTQQGTCKLESSASQASSQSNSNSANTKKAPGAVCTVLTGGNANTECQEGYYCKSSTQKAGSSGKCAILP